MSDFTKVSARDFASQIEQLSFDVFVSRTLSERPRYVGLVERGDIKISRTPTRSKDATNGGAFLDYKWDISFFAKQLTLESNKHIDSVSALFENNWFLSFVSTNQKDIAFTTPLRLGLSGQSGVFNGKSGTFVEASFLWKDANWLKGVRVDEPIVVSPVPNSINVPVSNSIVVDVESEVLMDVQVILGNEVVYEQLGIETTSGLKNGATDSRISSSVSPDSALLRRITIGLAQNLLEGVRYKIVVVVRRAAFLLRAETFFVTSLTKPSFVLPNSEQVLNALQSVEIQTEQGSVQSQEVNLRIERVGGGTVLNKNAAYSGVPPQRSVIELFRPSEYGVYNIRAEDFTRDARSVAAVRQITFQDRFAQLAAQSLFAWDFSPGRKIDGVDAITETAFLVSAIKVVSPLFPNNITLTQPTQVEQPVYTRVNASFGGAASVNAFIYAPSQRQRVFASTQTYGGFITLVFIYSIDIIANNALLGGNNWSFELANATQFFNPVGNYLPTYQKVNGSTSFLLEVNRPAIVEVSINVNVGVNLEFFTGFNNARVGNGNVTLGNGFIFNGDASTDADVAELARQARLYLSELSSINVVTT
jgi:hypothetical protein